MNAPTFLILAQMLDVTISARILGIFMLDAFSRFNVNNAIMETLATAGHNVTIISPFKPPNTKANMTYIQAIREVNKHESIWSQVDLKSLSWWQTYQIYQIVLNEECELFMALQETKEKQKIMDMCYDYSSRSLFDYCGNKDILAAKEKQFDLMFAESLEMSECYFAVAQYLDIPIIATSSVELRLKYQAVLGNPYYPASIAHYFSTYTSKMTFIERLKNTIETMFLEFLNNLCIQPQVEKFYQKYYPNSDPWVKKISLLFLNSHRSVIPLPYVPGIIDIGGIHLKEPQAPPRHMEEFIRGAEHGVILFSLGSLVTAKDLSPKTRQIFVNVFAKIPQRVIWKFEEKVKGISDNVIISEWIPQGDILAQENVILFISHAGRNSILEAIHTATPVLAISLFEDQFSNAGNVKELGIGTYLDFFTISEASLLSSIQEILQDSSFEGRAKKLSQKFHDRPLSPKETVLYWTEYVLRHNGTTTNHLQTTAAHMPFYHYLLLDVMLFIILIIVLMSIIISCVMKKTRGHNCFQKKFAIKSRNPKCKTVNNIQ